MPSPTAGTLVRQWLDGGAGRVIRPIGRRRDKAAGQIVGHGPTALHMDEYRLHPVLPRIHFSILLNGMAYKCHLDDILSINFIVHILSYSPGKRRDRIDMVAASGQNRHERAR